MPSRHERLDDQHTEERPQTGVAFDFSAIDSGLFLFFFDVALY